MGIVYLAEDPALSRKVALKVLYPNLLADSGFLHRFRAEAQAIAALESQYIVRINSMNEYDGRQVAIDMEYVDGGIISPHMNGLVANARVAFHVLEGLGACHRLGVIHRDIKPNNLLISHTGVVKIADFGLATAFSDHVETNITRGSSSGFFMGTPRYAPPEAWEGATATPVWDLYSLGMVLYEGVTKQTVYGGTSPLAIAKQIAAAPPAPVRSIEPAISEGFGALIDRMVSHDPKARPQDVDEALDCLADTSEFQAMQLEEPETVRVSRPVNVKDSGTNSIRWPRKAVSRYLFAGTLLFASLAVGVVIAIPILPRRGPDSSQTLHGNAGGNSIGVPETTGEGVSAISGESHAPIYIGTELEQLKGSEYLWLVDLDRDAGTGSAIVCWENGVGSAALVERDSDTFTINGNWAAFRDPAGRSIQIGSLSGTVQATSDGLEMVVSLQWVDERSRTERGSVQTLIRSATYQSASDYWMRMEEMRLVQPLIYAELLPRSLNWVNAIEANFGSLGEDRALVPIIEDATPPEIDGELTDDIWQSHYFDNTGRIGEVNLGDGPGSSVCVLRVVDDSLYIGIRTAFANSTDSRISVSAAPSIHSPLPEMQTFSATWSGLQLDDARLHIGDREAPWNCDWVLFSKSDDSWWQAEIEIPISEFAISQSNRDGHVIRLNVSVELFDEEGAIVCTAKLGSQDVNTVEHGAVLRLTNQYETN